MKEASFVYQDKRGFLVVHDSRVCYNYLAILTKVLVGVAAKQNKGKEP